MLKQVLGKFKLNKNEKVPDALPTTVSATRVKDAVFQGWDGNGNGNGNGHGSNIVTSEF